MVKKREEPKPSQSNDFAADYCHLGGTEENRLSNFERLTLVGGSDLDRVVGLVLRQMAHFSSAGALEGLDVQALRQAADFYGQEIWRRDPGSFFVPPSGLPPVREIPVHGLVDGSISDLQFPSRYQAHHPEGAARLAADSENMVVQARYWRHNAPARGTIVAIHGWTMGDQRLNSIAFLPGLLYRNGFDVVLPELPFHGRRRSVTHKGGSGALFPSTDSIRTNEALGQIISDLRDLAAILAVRSTSPLGCIGMSLGAYVAALWASLREADGRPCSNLSFCVPIVPLISMVEIAWELVTRELPNLVSQETDLFEVFERCFSVHCPLSHSLALPRDRVFLIAGIGDAIVPARQPKLLWDHWRRPEIRWISGGHQALFEQKSVFEAMFQFLNRVTSSN